MTSDFNLYWASGSPPCWRVMIALEEKGVGYEKTLISFEKNEHKSEKILQWNPRGQVPTLVHKSQAINESLAACDYLEAVFKKQGTSLLPEDPEKLGLVLQRKYEFLNLDRKGGEIVYYIFRNKADDIDQDVLQKKLEEFHLELKIWDRYLGQSGPYLAGKDFSIADILFFPNLAFYIRLGLNLDDKEKNYPNLKAYYEKLKDRESVKKSWPPHWVGTEAPKQVFKEKKDE